MSCFEHAGEATLPTSIFVCETGGMVVICAGTTGYNATADLRYLWMRQKRLQGSHFANDEQAEGLNRLVIDQKVRPCLSSDVSVGATATAASTDVRKQAPTGQYGCPCGLVRARAGCILEGETMQRAFILYMTTWGSEQEEIERETNLDQLNALLAEGWRVANATPMSGHGEDDDETRCLIILQRE